MNGLSHYRAVSSVFSFRDLVNSLFWGPLQATALLQDRWELGLDLRSLGTLDGAFCLAIHLPPAASAGCSPALVLTPHSGRCYHWAASTATPILEMLESCTLCTALSQSCHTAFGEKYMYIYFLLNIFSLFSPKDSDTCAKGLGQKRCLGVNSFWPHYPFN